jgi:hypothetical protein
VGLGVVGHHERDAEVVELGAGQGDPDEPAGVADHEGDALRRRLLGRQDEVAFVLTLGVVDHDQEFTPPEGFDRLLDAGEGHRSNSSCPSPDVAQGHAEWSSLLRAGG